MEERLAPLMDEIRKTLAMLESSLPERLDPTAISPISKLPFKALLYRESLIWRMAELCGGALENFKEERFVSGILLTRAAVETTAALCYLCGNIAAAVESGAVGELDDYLMNLMMGAAAAAPAATPEPKDGETSRPLRIDAFLKQADQEVEGFSFEYGMLAKYVSPDRAGTTLVYSKQDAEKQVTLFGPNLRISDKTWLAALGTLAGALKIFVGSYNRISELIPALERSASVGLTKSSTAD